MTTPLWDKSFCSSGHRCSGVIWLPELRAGESDTGMTTQAVARRWQRNVIKTRKLPCHLPVLSATDSAGLKIDMKFGNSRELCDEGHSSGFKPRFLSRGKQGKGPRWFICYRSLWCTVRWWRNRRHRNGKIHQANPTDNQSKKYERDLNEPSRKNWLPLTLCGSLDQEMF